MATFLSLAVISMGCGSPARETASPAPSIAARDGEKWFTSEDGWEFLAPKDFARNTSPGTTGFAVSRPAPPRPQVALVLTTEGFDGDVNAFVAKERAKLEIMKERASGRGVVVEERWKTGPDEYGMAMVLLDVQNGSGVRLACIARDTEYEAQRPICERAIESLRRLHQTP